MSERILIIDDDVDTLRLVGLMLQRQGYKVSAASNGPQGLVKAFEDRPDLILLDVMMPDMDGYEVTRRLRKNPATAAIPILMFTAKTQLDDKVTGFEVGADDYLTKPTHPTELEAHVRTLLARTSAKNTGEIQTVSQEKHGYVIGFLSTRGGMGVTTVAANVAAAIFNRTHEDVILAEFTPGQGTLGIDLGVSDQAGLSEILKGLPAEVTREKVQASLAAHGSGIKVMASSDNPKDVDLASRAGNFEALVTRLSTLAKFVVLDLGSGLPSFVQKVLPLCAERILIMEGMQHSIQNTKILLDEIIGLKVDPKTISVVLNNRQRSEAQIPKAQAQTKLGHSILTVLTPMPELFMQASRLHTPAIVAQPENMVAQQFLKIADAIIEREKAR
ncbi:MAG: response regulator [Anaerolineales bacterium]|nr:response regulator [Anaerolineales bacterium]MCB9111512.1 response regulator [Anaerolineales bacterium]